MGARDAQFPSWLRGLCQELWWKGDRLLADALLCRSPGNKPAHPQGLHGLVVTIVGSRQASSEGLLRAERLGGELARRGAIVVSGGAIGIDAAAHRGALLAGGKTCAVLGCGLDALYPRHHLPLYATIAQTGLLLSSFPPATPGFRPNFPKRNRIMAALCDLVVVVEAQAQSGTRHTIEAARQALPARPVLYFAGAAFPAALVRLGAHAATSLEQVLTLIDRWVAGDLPDAKPCAGSGAAQQVALFPPDPRPPIKPDRSPAPPAPADLDPTSQRLFALLCGASEPQDLSELSVRTQYTAAECAAAIIELELRGLCSRLPGGRYIGHAPLY